MKKLLTVLTLIGVNCTAFAGETTLAGIPLDVPWKKTLYQFAQKNSTDTAWGLAHSERDYLLAVKIAKAEGMDVERAAA